MARQSSVGWACGWLVSAVFGAWIEKELSFPWPFSKLKNEMRVHTRFASTCNIFRVRGVIVHMHYLPSQKFRWPNSIWVAHNSSTLGCIWRCKSQTEEAPERAKRLSNSHIPVFLWCFETSFCLFWTIWRCKIYTQKHHCCFFVTLSFTAPKSSHFLLIYTALFCLWFPKGQCTTSEVSSTPTWLWLLALLSCFSCSVWTWPRIRLVILLLCKSLEVTAKTVLCRRLERLTCSQETLSPWLTHDYRAHVSANEQNCCVLKGRLQCRSVFCGTILHSLPTFNRPPPDFKVLTGLYLPAHSWSF